MVLPEALMLHVRLVPSGSLASTLKEVTFVTPVGIATRTQAVSEPLLLLGKLVTVSVYVVGLPSLAVVGSIPAVNRGLSVNTICAIQLDVWPTAVARNLTPRSSG